MNHCRKIIFVKPQPEIYKIALQKINCKPEETVFIDDMQKYVDGANAVGIHGILFQDAEQLKDDLKKLGVKV
ncbi:HAD-IA family hydrolase [Candidatus Woesearchaeota archaeon]|nr:HAD-IA family hydrolase [Candidatus Woesearchaeota archaeon]